MLILSLNCRLLGALFLSRRRQNGAAVQDENEDEDEEL